MTKLVLDTNIWIYLTKSEFTPLLERLKEMSANKELEIITNEVIIAEWDRNKQTTIKNLSINIESEYKSAIKLAEYLPKENVSDYLATLSSYKDENHRLKQAGIKVDEVEMFMKNNKVVSISDDQKLHIANLAIEKKHPFKTIKTTSMTL